uniref:Caspase-9-like isoform X3 n=1 Tax=Parasteatoda tepidariorum TaxID=114398 RepID=A0A2L2YLJ8_PARTP
MDPASRLILKQNEKSIKKLDMSKLRPLLIEFKIFTNFMLSDIYDPKSDANLFDELPTRGPNAFSKFVKVLERAGYTSLANELKNTPKYAETPKVKSVFYSMKSKPLGYCVIINNVQFDLLEERIGSDVDAKELQKLFKEFLGFSVEVKHNMEGKDMKRYLKSFAKSDTLKTVDCCFVIILSHGDKHGIVYGTDSYALQKDEIHNMFSNINCENLRNKPKVFLYQACRGSGEDHGIESADSPNELEYNDSVTRNSVTETTDALKFETNTSPVLDTTDAVPFKANFSSSLKKDPSENDILIVHSSHPDHKAYRDHICGSWFIQDIISVFKEEYKYYDLEYMLKSVSRKIQERLSLRGQKKQVPHSESKGFRALLHLCSNEDYKGCDMAAREYLFQ